MNIFFLIVAILASIFIAWKCSYNIFKKYSELIHAPRPKAMEDEVYKYMVDYAIVMVLAAAVSAIAWYFLLKDAGWYDAGLHSALPPSELSR